jgi:hypothetical protein
MKDKLQAGKWMPVAVFSRGQCSAFAKLPVGVVDGRGRELREKCQQLRLD